MIHILSGERERKEHGKTQKNAHSKNEDVLTSKTRIR